MIEIIISNTSDKPIYRQLYEQLSAQILKGQLVGDEGLPPIRTVAKELRISIITVKKAWEELERDGLIYSMVGRGCFVSELSSNELDSKRDNVVYNKLKKDLEYYKGLGLDEEDIIKKIKELY